RQIDGPRTFTITLTNRGDRDHTFTTGSTCVIAEKQVAKEANTTSCTTAETLTAATTQVTVPAGGTTTIDYTLTPEASTRHWTQGWATLDSTDDTQPDLVVPYLGFVGDWNAEPIIDHPVTSEVAPLLYQILGPEQQNLTGLIGPLGEMGIRTNWMSPNGDGFIDKLLPAYMLLRSAGDVEFEVLKDGEVVRSLGKQRDQLRLSLTEVPHAVFSAADVSPDHGWDGTLYNPATGELEKVPDAPVGAYTFRIKARLSEDFDWQITDMPVGIDTVAPQVSYTVETGADGSRTYTILATDADSDIPGELGISVNDPASKADLRAVETGPNTYEIAVPAEVAESDSYLQVKVMDNAGNVEEFRDFYQTKPVRVLDSHLLDRWMGNHSLPFRVPEVTDGKATLNLLLAPEVTKATFNGTPVEIKDGKAQIQAPVNGGRNDYEFIAYSANGQELGRTTHWLGYDTTPPTLELTSIPLDAQGRLILDPDGTVTISGRVTDDLSTADDLALIHDTQEFPLDAEGRFTHTFDPGGVGLFLSVNDHAQQLREKAYTTNEARHSWFVSGADIPSEPEIEFDDYEHLGTYMFGDAYYFVTPAFQNLEIINQDAGPGEVAARLTLKGKFTEKPNSFQVAGKEVPLDDDLRLSIPIDLVNGLTQVGYVVVGADGTRYEGSWRFFYDRALPGLDLKMDPKLHADGAIYLPKTPADVTLSGEVWDNEFGYKLSVNGNVLEEFTNHWDPGANPRLPFRTSVANIQSNQIMRLGLMDQASNGFEQRIPLVIDTQAPTLAIDGPTTGAAGLDTEFTVTVTDDNWESLQVLLDGRQIAAEVVAPVPHPQAGYVEIRQGEEVPPSTAPGEKPASSKQVIVRLKDVPDLAKGRHTLIAVATDKAGHAATAASTFVLDEAPTITGPDSLTIEAGKDPRQVIRETYQATDPEDGALELHFDHTRLTSGTIELELSATDSAGNTTRRTISVTLAKTPPQIPGQPGQPGQPGKPGVPQKPSKPTPPITRPGLPRTGG
ncbi:Fn3-like domain-containing protein, partial [Arachnia propionica]